MSDCRKLEPLLTPYVDGEAPPEDRSAVDAHVRVCPPCASRVNAERSVRALLHARRPALEGRCAPAALRARCRQSAVVGHQSSVSSRQSSVGSPQSSGFSPPSSVGGRFSAAAWRRRAMPLALAASLTLVVSGAFLYQATSLSSRVLAAELAADHVKCFAANRMMGVHHDSVATTSTYLASSFGWDAKLPHIDGLSLEAARPCLYGEGRAAHVMYRYGDRPVSLFMLPGTSRHDELVEVLGHEAAIWSVDGRTFVLIARESRDEVSRLVAAVQRDTR